MYGLGSSDAIDAVLLGPGDAQTSQRDDFIAHCKGRRIAVVALTDGKRPAHGVLQHSGVDGVVSVDATDDDLACALWSAHQHVTARGRISEELESLRTETAQRRVVDHAKSIIAERSNISEADALRKLRREARNRRRPMHELATVVVDAQNILIATLNSANAKQPGGRRNGKSP